MQDGLWVGKDDKPPIQVIEARREKGAHDRPFRAQVDPLHQAKVSLVLRDGRVDPLASPSPKGAHEVPARVDRDVTIEVLALEHKVASSRKHQKVNLGGEPLEFQVEIMNHHKGQVAVSQLKENAILPDDACLEGTDVGVKPPPLAARNCLAQ